MRARWPALVRCFDDGRLALDNNAAERALRGVAIGRKNYLFAGSDAGGRRAATMYSLIETAKLSAINPQHYLADVLARIADHPARQIADHFALELATRRGHPRRCLTRRLHRALTSEQTFYRWKKLYGGLGTGERRRLKQLEEENRKLKQLVADLSLDILQDVLSKKL
jgi:hypothetical protein